MLIGIDASRANKSNKTGTEWYSWHLIEELKKIAPSGDTFKLYTNSKLAGDLEKMPSADWQEKILSWPPKYLWTQIKLWWELRRNPPDVLLVPAHTIPLLPIARRTKVLVNVHDVGFRRFPELYKPIQVWYHDLTMKRIKSRADLIITISEFSKQEIIDLYGVKSEKIRVVHLGFDDQVYHEQSAADVAVTTAKYGLVDPYILYVGRLEKKKNIGNIVKAFALVKNVEDNLTPPDLPFRKGEENPLREFLPPFTKGRVGEGLKLVLAGSSGNQYEDIKKIISDLKLEREIILTGYAPQDDLPQLMAGAKAFIFPTLYEGFGLPILEAMACGTPVIASDMAPHTEVGGNAAVYVDPKSPEKLADAIIKVVENDDFRRQVVESGVLRAKEFSWRKTAERVYEIIHN